MTPQRLQLLLRRPFHEVSWSDYLGDDCHVRIANDPPAVGKAASLELLDDFRGRIIGFGTFVDLWQSRDAIFVETEVLVPRGAGGMTALPCTVVARATTGQLRDIRFHLDPTPIRNG